MHQARRAFRIRSTGAAVTVLAWRQCTPACEQERQKRPLAATFAAAPSSLCQPALLHDGAVLADQRASAAEFRGAVTSSPAPSSWYGQGLGGGSRAGGASPGTHVSHTSTVALPSTGKQVLRDICSSFARMESNRGALSERDGLPSYTLVHALETTTLFFPVIFGYGVFTSLILRKVGRHIAQLNLGAQQAASNLVDAPPEVLYTCGRTRHGPTCPRPTATDEEGTLLYPVQQNVMVPWAHVLDMRDVVLWELASKGAGARDDRHSVIHALQWSVRLLHFMLVFMDTMLAHEGGKRTPNAAAKEAYDKAFRPHHNIMQVSAARTGIAFVTSSRSTLTAQMGFGSEQEAEQEMAEAAEALRPVVHALQVFMLENGLEKGGNHSYGRS